MPEDRNPDGESLALAALSLLLLGELALLRALEALPLVDSLSLSEDWPRREEPAALLRCRGAGAGCAGAG